MWSSSSEKFSRFHQMPRFENEFSARPEVMQDTQVREVSSLLQSMVAKFVNAESIAYTTDKEIVERVERSRIHDIISFYESNKLNLALLSLVPAYRALKGLMWTADKCSRVIETVMSIEISYIRGTFMCVPSQLKLVYMLFTVYVFTELKTGWDVPRIIANIDTHFNTLAEFVTSIWLGPLAFARLTELDHFMKIYPRLTCIFWHRFLTMKSLRAGDFGKWLSFRFLLELRDFIALQCVSCRVKVIRNEFDVRPEVTEDNQVQEASNSLKMVRQDVIEVSQFGGARQQKEEARRRLRKYKCTHA
ncbi:hypothetical protein Tco_0839446 [Tanacetum coccineum]|uniref:Uncharacterized protein n=1 Tax=Tanacetum coccineum TaxID=301880 RepID=A0ABQ5ASI1_9ASTR